MPLVPDRWYCNFCGHKAIILHMCSACKALVCEQPGLFPMCILGLQWSNTIKDHLVPCLPSYCATQRGIQASATLYRDWDLGWVYYATWKCVFICQNLNTFQYCLFQWHIPSVWHSGCKVNLNFPCLTEVVSQCRTEQRVWVWFHADWTYCFVDTWWHTGTLWEWPPILIHILLVFLQGDDGPYPNAPSASEAYGFTNHTASRARIMAWWNDQASYSLKYHITDLS